MRQLFCGRAAIHALKSKRAFDPRSVKFAASSFALCAGVGQKKPRRRKIVLLGFFSGSDKKAARRQRTMYTGLMTTTHQHFLKLLVFTVDLFYSFETEDFCVVSLIAL